MKKEEKNKKSTILPFVRKGGEEEEKEEKEEKEGESHILFLFI
jgi:hypothetical protein